MKRKMFPRSLCAALVLAWSATADSGQPEQAKPLELPKPAAPKLDSEKPFNLVPIKSSESAEPPLAAAQRVVWLNNKEFRIKYGIKNAGPSGVLGVRVWVTRDGGDWGDKPSVQETDTVVVRTPGDGSYGISLTVLKGDGRSSPPPKTGDRPQFLVHVDSTPPHIVLYACEVGEGAGNGKVNIRWSASDKNFPDKPISLYYAKQATGPWEPIAEKIANSGNWTWEVPKQILPRVYIHCKAVDKAGNVGEVTSRNPVIIDFAKPEAVILGVEPIAEKTR